MERLVSDLLRLARLDAARKRSSARPCSVEGLFSAVVNRSGRPARGAPAAASTVDVARRRRRRCRGDPAKLQDVLRNLLENATNYSPEGATHHRAGAPRSGDRIVLTVADEGPGIPPSDLTRIFERFYRVDKSRTRDDPGGTGLGLSIVRHLVELHGGDVAAANRAGGGAVFTVASTVTYDRLAQAASERERDRPVGQRRAIANAAAGIVRTQAQTIWPATPQRTADSRRVAPTPTIAPVIVCVVLTGTPRCVAVNSEIAPRRSPRRSRRPAAAW